MPRTAWVDPDARRGDRGRAADAGHDEEVMQLLASDTEAPSVSAASRAAARLQRFAAGALGVACVIACGAVAVLRCSAAAPAGTAPPATVRALLESGELADITAHNLIAINGEAVMSDGGREAVVTRVTRALRNVSHVIREGCPEEHRQLERLTVNATQRAAVFKELRRFGEQRMVVLTRNVAEAFAENAADRGDGEALRRRLSERLGAKLGDLQELRREMFPDGQVEVRLVPASSSIEKWHPQLEIDFGRRLSAVGEGAIESAARVHALAMLESMQRQLGPRMPSQPARMLSFFSMGSGDSGSKEQSFMNCVKAALPDPTKVMKCIADNMDEVAAMVMKFLKGRASGSH